MFQILVSTHMNRWNDVPPHLSGRDPPFDWSRLPSLNQVTSIEVDYFNAHQLFSLIRQKVDVTDHDVCWKKGNN